MLFKIQRQAGPIQVLAFLITLVAISRLLFFNMGVTLPLYYGVMFIGMVLCFSGRNIRYNLYLLVFVYFAYMSILLNDIPSYFLPYDRLISFLIIVGLVSPLIAAEKLDNIRLLIFKNINRVFLVIVVLSFLGHFSRIYPGSDWSGFRGVTNHSMTLGPVAALAIFLSIDHVFKIDISRQERYRYLLLAIMSFITMLLAASRGAVLGAVLGLFVYFFKKYYLRLGKFLQITLAVIFIVVASSGFWSGFTTNLQRKNAVAQAKGDAAASRSDNWKFRVIEFKESPLYGIGFSHLKYGLIDKKSGIVEPASSWLAVFSMTGFLGGIAFTIFIFSILIKLILAKSSQNAVPILLALLVFFIVHWFFEGYILASGAFEFFYSWLLLGVIDIYHKTGKVDVL